MIDSVRVDFTICPGKVATANNINAVELLPNPAYNDLTINATGQLIHNVVITNLIGQTIYKHDDNVAQMQIDISGFPSGIYFVRINNTIVRKFVKE